MRYILAGNLNEASRCAQQLNLPYLGWTYIHSVLQARTARDEVVYLFGSYDETDNYESLMDTLEAHGCQFVRVDGNRR